MSAVWWWMLASLAVEPRPNASLSPGEVIRTVVESLQKRNSPSPNAGIYTVYQFAAPENRASTGPYGNFLRLLKHPIFAPLLTRRETGYGPLSVSGDQAGQDVSFRMEDGRTVWFHFVVARQTSGQTHGLCTGCWMVAEVSPLSAQ